MKQVLILVVGLLAAPVFADAAWVICWEKKVAGVSADGRKVFCKKCVSKKTGKWGRYDIDPFCKIFTRKDDAVAWYSENCDCD